MSASAMIDGCVTLYTNASKFGPSHVSKDYSALETSPCAIVVQNSVLDSTANAYGRERRHDRTLRFDLWLSDTGDPNLNALRWLEFEDAWAAEIVASQTLNSTACAVESIRLNRDFDVYTYSGQQWYHSIGEVDAWETE